MADLNWLAFSLAAIITDMRQVKEEQKKAKWNQNQKCYESIAKRAEKICDLVGDVSHRAGKAYIPLAIMDGIKVLPLYACGMIISQQRSVTKEQIKVLKLFFKNLSLPFSLQNYLSEMQTTGCMAPILEVVHLNPDRMGEFWTLFFRALYKAGTQEELQKIADCMMDIMIHFSILGNPESQIAANLCEEFINAYNRALRCVEKIPKPGETDWFCNVSIKDHLQQIRKLYQAFLQDSDILESISRDNLNQLFDIMFLSSVSEMIMLGNQSRSIKVQMVEEALKLIPIEFPISGRDWINGIENEEETVSFWSRCYFADKNELGMFWSTILILPVQVGRKDDFGIFMTGIMNILIGVENELNKKYEFPDLEKAAQKYIFNIIECMQVQQK